MVLSSLRVKGREINLRNGGDQSEQCQENTVLHRSPLVTLFGVDVPKIVRAERNRAVAHTASPRRFIRENTGSPPHLSTKGAQKGASGRCPKTRKLLHIARPRLTPKTPPEPAPEVGNDLRQASLQVSGSENLAKTVTMACGAGR